jgi:hypothetical protein
MMLGSPAGRHHRRAFCLQPLPAWPGTVARHLAHDNPARKIIVEKDARRGEDQVSALCRHICSFMTNVENIGEADQAL